MIWKTKINALLQFVANNKKEMHKYKETDLKYDLARGFQAIKSQTKKKRTSELKMMAMKVIHVQTVLKQRPYVCIDCAKTEHKKTENM